MCFNYFHLKAFRTIGESGVTGMKLAFDPTRDGNAVGAFSSIQKLQKGGVRAKIRLPLYLKAY